MSISSGASRALKGRHGRRRVGLPHDVSDEHRCFCEEAWASIAARFVLSKRQVEIARDLFAGQGDKQIARRFGISPYTVQTHTKRLYEKLKVHSRMELAALLFAAYSDWQPSSDPPDRLSQELGT